MTAWLLSVAGAGILGVIISYLTSKTRLHSVIKTACTYVFLLVLVFPLPALIAGGTGDGSSCGIFDSEIEYDDDILDTTNEAYFSIVSGRLKRTLKEDGYEVDVTVKGSIAGDKATVSEVLIVLHGEFADSSTAALKVGALAADYLLADISVVKVQIG